MENEEKDIYTTPGKISEEKQKLIVDLTMAEARRRTIRAILIFVFVVVVLLLLIIVYVVPGQNRKQTKHFQDDLFDAGGKLAVSKSVPAESMIDSEITELQETIHQQDEQGPRLDAVNPQTAAEAMGEMRVAKDYFTRQEWNDAELHVRKALGLYPGMNAAQRMLGIIYTHRGQFDQAVIILEEALKTDPFNAETYNNLATAYMQQGKMDKAEELLLNSLRMKPDYTLSLLNLGLLYLAQGEYELAANYFERGLPSVMDDVNVRNNYAVCLLRLGRYEEAREQFGIIIQQKRDMAPAYFNTSISYVLEGNIGKAIEWIEDGAQFCSPMMLQRFLSDPDFDGIRQESEFRYIMEQLSPRVPQGPELNAPL